MDDNASDEKAEFLILLADATLRLKPSGPPYSNNQMAQILASDAVVQFKSQLPRIVEIPE